MIGNSLNARGLTKNILSNFLVFAFLIFAVISCGRSPEGALVSDSQTGSAPKIIILLDLNYTFVQSPASEEQDESYRAWLKNIVEKHYTILITARPQKDKKKTLENIKKTLDWQPDEAYFNEENLSPPDSKKLALKRYVFPKHGLPEKVNYAAIESNPRTTAMYAEYGIPSLRVWR